MCVLGAGSRSASESKVETSRKWIEVTGSSWEDLAQSMASGSPYFGDSDCSSGSPKGNEVLRA